MTGQSWIACCPASRHRPRGSRQLRRFCGFSTGEPTPERTAFVRFRRALIQGGLDRSLFAAVTHQLEGRGAAVRTGTLVDATLIASASIGHDGEARCAGHRHRKPVHGYKAHVATDRDAVLIRGVEVTTANVHDAAELAAILPDKPGHVYGDSAFAGSKPEAAIRARGDTPMVVHTGTWGGALPCPACVGTTPRCDTYVPASKVFGTAKRSYGMRRMRWAGTPAT